MVSSGAPSSCAWDQLACSHVTPARFVTMRRSKTDSLAGCRRTTTRARVASSSRPPATPGSLEIQRPPGPSRAASVRRLAMPATGVGLLLCSHLRVLLALPRRSDRQRRRRANLATQETLPNAVEQRCASCVLQAHSRVRVVALRANPALAARPVREAPCPRLHVRPARTRHSPRREAARLVLPLPRALRGRRVATAHGEIHACR